MSEKLELCFGVPGPRLRVASTEHVGFTENTRVISQGK